MKILLADDVNPRYVNGVSLMVSQLGQELRSMGHDVRRLQMSESNRSYRKGYDYHIASFPIPIYPNARQSLKRSDPCIAELIRWKPDVIHIHTEFSAAEICRRISAKTGAPFMMTRHTDYRAFYMHDTYDHAFTRAAFAIWGQYVYRGASVAAVPSRKGKTVTACDHLNCPVVVVNNGIDLSAFQRTLTDTERNRMLQRYGIRYPEKLLVMVTRLSQEKCVQDILDMMPKLLALDPEIVLMIVGDGPDAEKLRQYAVQLGIQKHVIFTGFVQNQETWRYYKLGRIFLSASDREMASLSIREALACGLPFVCRKDPALWEILDQCACGATFQTPEEFIRHVMRLLHDKALYRSMSQAALRKAKSLSMTACARKYLHLYQKIVRSF